MPDVPDPPQTTITSGSIRAASEHTRFFQDLTRWAQGHSDETSGIVSELSDLTDVDDSLATNDKRVLGYNSSSGQWEQITAVEVSVLSGVSNALVIGDGSDTITLNPTSAVSFSDKNITNVGSAAVDSLIAESSALVIGAGVETITLSPATAVSFSDKAITNVSDIALRSISSDSSTTITINLGTDPGDDLIVGNNALVVEGDTGRAGFGTLTPDTDVEIVKSAPEVRMTSSADSNYTRVTRNSVDGKATRYNTVLRPAGSGNALDFDGVDDRTNHGDVTGMQSITKMSVSFWYFSTGISANDGWMAKWGATDSTGSWTIQTGREGANRRRLEVFFFQTSQSGSESVSNTILPENAWAHIAFTWDGGEATPNNRVKLWVDGVNVSSQANTGNPVPTSLTTSPNEVFTIGEGIDAQSPRRTWPGLIDDPAIWGDRKLADSDITDIYAAGVGAKIDPTDVFPTSGVSQGTNLVLVCAFDETAMNTAPGGKDVEDASGNGWHGTAEGTMVDGDFVAGIIAIPGEDIELPVWTHEDGAGASESGILTFGSNVGSMKYNGATQELQIAGTTIIDVANDSTVSINSQQPASESMIINKALNQSASTLEMRDSLGVADVVFDAAGGLALNQQNSSTGDFTVKGETDDSLLQVDVSLDRIGIGRTAPQAKVDIRNDSDSITLLLLAQAGSTENVLRINDQSGANAVIMTANCGWTFNNQADEDGDFQVKSNTGPHMLFVDSGNDAVCINTDTYSAVVNGTTKTSRMRIVQNFATNDLLLQIAGHGNAAVHGPTIASFRSRGVHDSEDVLQDGDYVVHMPGFGYDGTDYIPCVEIRGEVDGTPGANDMPGAIVFSTTAVGAATLTEAARIDSERVFHTASGRKPSITRVTGGTTLDSSYHIVFVNTDSGDVTITLPAVVGVEYLIKNTGSSGNEVVITPDGADDLIGENESFSLTDGETLLLHGDTTDGWY